MEFLKRVLEFLDYGIETPQPYGWFHLLFFALSIAAGILLCVTHRSGDDKRVRRAVLVTAIIVAILEIYKQINYSFSYTGEVVTFDYQWYIFPFQFCSMPMYVGLLTGVFRKGRIHNALMAFLATYAIFGGTCVMFYPDTVFISTLGINIQTMVCHGSMITVGIYLWYSDYVKTSHKTILKAMAVFAVAVICAVAMNELAHVTGLLEEHTFNMFFVSPHCDPSLPVYSLVQAAVPYPWCLMIYFAGFSAAAYLVSLAVMGCRKAGARRAEKIRKRIYGDMGCHL
ncbi:MAG: YwaF family protein [Clostridia bacterium]|nr:YwaF family protein [Clostridia bacterium]